MTDIEGFAAGGGPTNPSWYSNASLVSLMKEIKIALPDHVLIFPVQVNYWGTVDSIGGGIDFARMAEATDGLFLMAYDFMWLWDMKFHDGSTSQKPYGNFTGMSGRAGPNSDLSVLRNSIAEMTSPDFFMHVPLDKLVVGLPWYGCEWRPSLALSCAEIVAGHPENPCCLDAFSPHC